MTLIVAPDLLPVAKENCPKISRTWPFPLTGNAGEKEESFALSSSSPTKGFNLFGKIAFGTSHRGNQFEYGKLKDIIDNAMTLLSGFSASIFFWVSDLLSIWSRGCSGSWRVQIIFLVCVCGYFHNEKVLEEHLDPARPKPQHEDITDVMLGLAKDRTTVIHLAKDHMKAILLKIDMGEEFGLNIWKKLALKLVPVKYNWED
ncbi:hypothetical protein RHMOL_Rhmol13G0074200 [Rhododendron molle]|uniref:Uncharacterized protein n=1 Tax=Rhododendron molle TaxID=49168 RepID=A0ACC0L5C1_RHOML|nr:hypothetical protein RHMOL_Rhmol13G0074200 [Rhododendron molle]